ncbi:MAG TPA: nicotinate phosphoribosyltransferase [Gammaproteobacteria bacterium]|nr:nicotinate phosphoribosyltransferase [Gammaproteobacteria bacterium]
MIIESLLDTDLYKFTMMQAVLHQFPSAEAEYRFQCRGPDVDLRPFASEIRDEIAHLCDLRLSDDELGWLRALRYISNDFIEFLRFFHLQERFIEVDDAGEQLDITIHGPWLHTILFEVPVLAIVNQLYFRNSVWQPDLDEGRRRLTHKIAVIRALPDAAEFALTEFGTRRRFSHDWQREVVATLAHELPDSLRGTSNLLWARVFKLTPIGTMAHEWMQAAQVLGPRLALAQRFAFQSWANEYRGDLGIALSDNYGLDAFLHDFDLYFCKLFDGARQDSGDPCVWAERVIAHYRANRIDPHTKTLVFSDSLDIPRAIGIFERFKHATRVAFGVGTHLTNDLGYTPLNIVIKMVRCNGQPVAKLSDDPDKTLCDDPTYLAYLRQVYSCEHSTA